MSFIVNLYSFDFIKNKKAVIDLPANREKLKSTVLISKNQCSDSICQLYDVDFTLLAKTADKLNYQRSIIYLVDFSYGYDMDYIEKQQNVINNINEAALRAGIKKIGIYITGLDEAPLIKDITQKIDLSSLFKKEDFQKSLRQGSDLLATYRALERDKKFTKDDYLIVFTNGIIFNLKKFHQSISQYINNYFYYIISKVSDNDFRQSGLLNDSVKDYARGEGTDKSINDLFVPLQLLKNMTLRLKLSNYTSLENLLLFSLDNKKIERKVLSEHQESIMFDYTKQRFILMSDAQNESSIKAEFQYLWNEDEIEEIEPLFSDIKEIETVCKLLCKTFDINTEIIDYFVKKLDLKRDFQKIFFCTQCNHTLEYPPYPICDRCGQFIFFKKPMFYRTPLLKADIHAIVLVANNYMILKLEKLRYGDSIKLSENIDIIWNKNEKKWNLKADSPLRVRSFGQDCILLNEKFIDFELHYTIIEITSEERIFFITL